MIESRVHIGDLADTIRGVTYEKHEASETARDSYMPLLRATNIHDGQLDFDNLIFVPDRVIKQEQRLRVGDIVLAASSGSLSVVGKAGLLRNPFHGTFGAFCYVVRPDRRVVLPEYLAYFMQTSQYRSTVSRAAAGININNLKREHIEAIELPFVGLTQQQRIVDAIDSYVSRLSAVVANLEGAQARLKAYRATMLRAAVEGRLVSTEAELARATNHEYEPASVLLKRILAEHRRRWEEVELAKLNASGRRPKDEEWKAMYQAPAALDTTRLPHLPDGWCWVSLEALLSEPLRNGHSSRGTRDSTGIRTLTLSAVTEADFGAHNTKLTVADPTKVKDLWLQPGDIFVERSNTPELVGTAALYVGAADFAVFPDLLIRVRCVSPILPAYLALVLRSPMVRRHFQKAAQGIAGSMPKISQGTIERLPVPLPPTAEQYRIADEADRLRSVELFVLSEIELDQRRCTRLRQAVMKWAFEGKLVDQDPNDEPADKFLDRVRVLRAAKTSVKQPRKRKTKVAL